MKYSLIIIMLCSLSLFGCGGGGGSSSGVSTPLVGEGIGKGLS